MQQAVLQLYFLPYSVCMYPNRESCLMLHNHKYTHTYGYFLRRKYYIFICRCLYDMYGWRGTERYRCDHNMYFLYECNVCNCKVL